MVKLHPHCLVRKKKDPRVCGKYWRRPSTTNWLNAGCGFRPSKLTIIQIFTMRIILWKMRYFGTNHLIIDLKPSWTAQNEMKSNVDLHWTKKMATLLSMNKNWNLQVPHHCRASTIYCMKQTRCRCRHLISQCLKFSRGELYGGWWRSGRERADLTRYVLLNHFVMEIFITF